jgi:hypothetical protein
VRSFEPYKLMTLLELFLPLGLLPLLGWRGLLVALPSLAYTFLSAHPNQFVIRYQYFSPALGWLIVAAVQGFRVWMSLWARFTARLAPGRWRTAVVLPLVVAVVATSVIDAYRKPIRPSFFKLHPYREELEILHRVIGPEASLSVTNQLAPPFAHRREYFLALDFTLNRELNAALGLPDYRDTAFHLFDLTALDHSQDRERRIAQLLADTRYGIRYYRFPLVLFERGLARRQRRLEARSPRVAMTGRSRSGLPAAFPGQGAKDLGVTGHARRCASSRVSARAGGPGISLPAGPARSTSFRLDAGRRIVADLDVVSTMPCAGASRRSRADFDTRRCQSFTLNGAARRRPIWISGPDTAPPFPCKVVVRRVTTRKGDGRDSFGSRAPSAGVHTSSAAFARSLARSGCPTKSCW